jgi:hypothetical protein
MNKPIGLTAFEVLQEESLLFEEAVRERKRAFRTWGSANKRMAMMPPLKKRLNKEEREPYLVIGRVSALGLCNFCHFASFTGGCDDADFECNHPLPIIYEGDHPGEVWCGADCWGFRPKYDLQTVGVIAGISLQGLIPVFRDGEWVGMKYR